MGNKAGKQEAPVAPAPNTTPAVEEGPGERLWVVDSPGYGIEETDMMDAHFTDTSGEKSVVALFDGHGQFGKDATKKAIEFISQFLEANKENPNKAEMLKQAFLDTHMKLTVSDVDVTTSGMSGTFVSVDNKELMCCNVGDATCVLGTDNGGKLTATVLSKNHAVTEAAEKERIESKGGVIKCWEIDNVGDVTDVCVWFGPNHPKSGAQAPGLRTGRCMGHTEAAEVGVLCEADVHSQTLTDKDKLMIVATHGLWAVVTAEEAVSAVGGLKCAKKASNLLLDMATSRWEEKWTGENTTIAVFYNM